MADTWTKSSTLTYAPAQVAGLTMQEQSLYILLLQEWHEHLNYNIKRMRYYDGHVDVRQIDLGVAIPKKIYSKLRKPQVQWVRKAVDALGDCCNFDGYAFGEGLPIDFQDSAQPIKELFGEAKTSTLISGVSFWTVTAGGDGEPAAVVHAYDGLHATALWDYRNHRILAGMAVTEIDPEHNDAPLAVDMYTEDAVIHCWRHGAVWKSQHYHHAIGRCLMVPMRYNPSLSHTLGTSRITTAMMAIENSVLRDSVRIELNSELYSSVSRWVLGADESTFAGNKRWQALVGAINGLPRDSMGNLPQIVQFNGSDPTPHVTLVRHYADLFAAESAVPVHSLMSGDQPSSSDAITAAENELVKKAQDFDRTAGEALQEIGYLVCAVAGNTAYVNLDKQALALKPRFTNPAHPSMSATADAMTKLAAVAPGLTDSRVFWESVGFDEPTVDRIMSDIARNGAASALAQFIGQAGQNQVQQSDAIGQNGQSGKNGNIDENGEEDNE